VALAQANAAVLERCRTHSELIEAHPG